MLNDNLTPAIPICALVYDSIRRRPSIVSAVFESWNDLVAQEAPNLSPLPDENGGDVDLSEEELTEEFFEFYLDAILDELESGDLAGPWLRCADGAGEFWYAPQRGVSIISSPNS